MCTRSNPCVQKTCLNDRTQPCLAFLHECTALEAAAWQGLLRAAENVLQDCMMAFNSMMSEQLA